LKDSRKKYWILPKAGLKLLSNLSKKGLDKSPFLCYNEDTKREEIKDMTDPIVIKYCQNCPNWYKVGGDCSKCPHDKKGK
jgi:hypothetical protein